ncbi:MAG: hypothetical protein U0790_16450 [Isosphaeraceae bacterium]
MLPTQETIDRLAKRIERAFSLRCRPWYHGCSTPRVWAAAASVLWETSVQNGEIPLDPELYVACQPMKRRDSDPWTCLANSAAGERYRRRVRRIIHRLRAELKREVVRAEELLQHGHGIGKVLTGRNPRFSALGLYITAHRAGRLDLAMGLRDRVIEQHLSCPLYRAACRPLLPSEDYPMDDRSWPAEPHAAQPLQGQLAPMN